MFGRLLRQPLQWLENLALEPTADDKDESATSDDMDDTQETPVVRDPYEPTILDVIVVKRMLNKAFNLPPELVDSIFDMAEYWPHTTTEIDYTQPGVQRRNAHGGRPSEDQFLIRTPPLGFTHSAYSSSPSSFETPPNPTLLEAEFPPSAFQSLTSPRAVTSLIHPCRKIVFTFLSRDQGWGNTGRPGPYLDSWTWFEVGLERCNKSSSSYSSSTPSFDPSSLATLNPPIERNPETGETRFAFPLLPREDCKIQCNVTVSHEKREHRVVWSWSDDVRAPATPSPNNKKSTTGDDATTNEDGNWGDDSTGSESTADGEAALAEVFESPEVKALEDIGRGKATGDGEFVRNLKLGDVVTVWAKARFGGWVNDVDRVKVDVYWAV